MRKMILASLICLVSSLALAQNYSSYYAQSCLRTVTNTDLLTEMSRRLSYTPVPAPVVVAPRSVIKSCLVIDTAFSKVFSGNGSTTLEAEAIARQECAKSVNSVYCNGPIRCGQPEVGSTGAFCEVVDSAFGKTFASSGGNAIDAEAKAKQACQASVNSVYCGNVTAKCETKY